MQILIISFFIGVLALQLPQNLPGLGVFIACFVGLLISLCFLKTKYFRYAKLFIPLICGFLCAWIYAECTSSFELPKELELQRVIVVGHISSLPQNFVDTYDHALCYSTFTMQTISINNVKQKTRLKLSWYNNHPNLKVGDKWQLEVKLKRPHTNFNPGSFDFEKYLFQHKIRATGYVVAGKNNFLLETKFLSYPLDRIRESLKDKIMLNLGDTKFSEIIIALILGDESGVEPPEWDVLRNTGTSYLLAISGLHISLVAWIFYFFVDKVVRFFPRLILVWPAQKIATVFGLLAAVIYSALSGFSVPTERALIMLFLMYFTIFLNRKNTITHTLCIALFFILLFDPLATLSDGFWLSFFAVFLIIYISYGRLKASHSHFKKYFRMQLTLTIGLLPFVLGFFQEASFLTLIANIIALPAICLLVVPLSLMGVMLLPLFSNTGSFILLLAQKIISYVWLWLFWLTKFSVLEFFVWQQAIYNKWIFISLLMGVLLLLLPRGFPAKSLFIIYFLPFVFYKPALPKYGEVWFSVLDVGQGLASVIQTQNHVLIYDTGPTFVNGDAGKNVVLPFLRDLGLKSIDTLVVSHGDDDHSGGANSVLQGISVKNILTSAPDKFPQYAAQNCFAGQSWQWDGVNFRMLYPFENQTLSGKNISNDASCVLRIASGANSILLTGDIEVFSEDTLIKNAPLDLPATILVAPHHGSKTSSTESFVNAVKPKYVLFSTGYLNHFHFPAEEVLARYEKIGTKLLEVVSLGTVTFKFDQKTQNFNPEFYRVSNRHFWNSE